MGTFLDDIFGPLTLDMVGLFGKSIVLTVEVAGNYDTETGAVVGGGLVPVTVPAIVEEFKGAELISGLVQAGDKKVSIAGSALAAAPKPTATVTIDGDVFTVVEVAAIYSGENVALYILKCRKA